MTLQGRPRRQAAHFNLGLTASAATGIRQRMKIIRYQDKQGNIGHAVLQADGTALKLAGNIFDAPMVTTEKAEMAKLLAPIEPATIICIGLNYRKHAEETKAKIPQFPVG